MRSCVRFERLPICLNVSPGAGLVVAVTLAASAIPP